MNDVLTLILTGLAGSALGAVFFGGLWWTVRRGMSSDQPAVWFLGSSLLRLTLAMTGFYVTADGDWKRLLACGLGFVVARPMVTRVMRPTAATNTVREPRHAAQS